MTSNTLQTKILIPFIFVFIGFGCFHHNQKYFSIRFENKGSREISKIEMHTNDGAYTIERLFSPGDVSVIGLQSQYPANAVYAIEWQYDGNMKYQKRFDLRSKLPEDFKGHVVFSFNEDNDVDFYQWMSPYQYDYSVELENRSKAPIYKPFIRSSGGVLFVKYKDELKVGDEIKVWNMKSFPANSVYTISWTTEEGKSYSEKFDFRDKLKEDFSGIIQFTINRPDKIEYSID